MTYTAPTTEIEGPHVGSLIVRQLHTWEPGQGPEAQSYSRIAGQLTAVTITYRWDFTTRQWTVTVDRPVFRSRLKSGEYGIERRAESYYFTSNRAGLDGSRALSIAPWLRELVIRDWPTSTFRIVEEHAGTEHNPEGA